MKRATLFLAASEARNIFDGSGNYLSLLADNPYFHSPEDRWPDSLDMESLEHLTEAWAEIVLALAGSG